MKVVLPCAAALAAFVGVSAAAQVAAPPANSEAPAAQVDVLTFVNGDRLTGKLLRGANSTIVFHSDMTGDITVPLSKVKELRTTGDFAVLQLGVPVNQSQALTPHRIVLTQSGVVVQGGNAAAVPLNDVAYLVDGATYRKDLAQRAGLLDGWSGTVTLGATLVQSTQHGGTFTAAGQLVRQVPVLSYFRARNKTTLNVQETYGTLSTPELPSTTTGGVPTAASTVKTSIFHADAEQDEYFSKRLYALGTTTFDHNFSQGLDLQQVYGAGVGFTPFSTPVHQLDLKADLHYEKQQFFDASTNQNLAGSTFSEAYRRTLPRKLVITQSLALLPAWNNLNAYSGSAAIGLVAPLLKRLSLNLNASDEYLNNPSPGYRKNSLQFVTGLSYSLR